MPTTQEFTIRQEDRPGTLGKPCQSLACEERPGMIAALAIGPDKEYIPDYNRRG